MLTLCRSLPLSILGLAVCPCGIFVCQAASISHIGAAGRARSVTCLYVSFHYVSDSFGAVLPGLLWSAGG